MSMRNVAPARMRVATLALRLRDLQDGDVPDELRARARLLSDELRAELSRRTASDEEGSERAS